MPLFGTAPRVAGRTTDLTPSTRLGHSLCHSMGRLPPLLASPARTISFYRSASCKTRRFVPQALLATAESTSGWQILGSPTAWTYAAGEPLSVTAAAQGVALRINSRTDGGFCRRFRCSGPTEVYLNSRTSFSLAAHRSSIFFVSLCVTLSNSSTARLRSSSLIFFSFSRLSTASLISRRTLRSAVR